MLLVAHWNGCMQFLVPVLHDFPDDSWVVLHDLRVCWVAFYRYIPYFHNCLESWMILLLDTLWCQHVKYYQNEPNRHLFFSQYKPWTEQYFWALFKALSHMLCIGYGLHPPQNIPETCVTISSMMTGATFYALFIAYSINVIQTMDSPGRSYKEKVRLSKPDPLRCLSNHVYWLSEKEKGMRSEISVE